LAEALVDLTLSEDSRKKGAERLSRMPVNAERRDEVAKALAAALSDSSESWTQAAILKALGVWWTPDTLSVLIDAAGDSDHWTKKAAFEALSRIDDDRAVRALAERLGEDRFEAVEALRQMGPRVEKIVLDYARQGSRQQRVAALEVLRDVGTRDSFSVLQRMIRSGDVQREAQEAMRGINGRRMYSRDKPDNAGPPGVKKVEQDAEEK
jgi:HEAT repeat protein